MISPTIDSIRVFLHLLAVAVWVGGQIVLAGIVPNMRQEAPDALPSIAKGFARVAWPAMIVIIFTGAWGLGSIEASNQSSQYMVTLGLKMMMVVIAIIATLIHSMGTTKAAKAIGGAAGLLASLLAAYGGVLLAHVG